MLHYRHEAARAAMPVSIAKATEAIMHSSRDDFTPLMAFRLVVSARRRDVDVGPYGMKDSRLRKRRPSATRQVTATACAVPEVGADKLRLRL